MSELQALERHYRRLLAWYPAAHRAAYGEELVGVLLASAPPGRRRPQLADAFDLVRGGLRMRLSPTRRGELVPLWSDTLAMLSLVAPALLAILAVPNLIWQLHFEITAPWFPPRMAVVTVMTMLGLTLPPLLALRGHRRTAAVAAAVASAFFLSNGGYALIGLLGPTAEQLSFGAMLALETVAILMSPGPRRGREILTARHWTIVITAVLVVTGLMLERLLYVDATRLTPLLRLAASTNLAIPAVVVLATVGLAQATPRPLAYRMLVLLTIPLYPYAVWVAFLTAPYGRENLLFVYLPTLTLTCSIGWFAVRSARRVRPGSSA